MLIAKPMHESLIKYINSHAASLLTDSGIEVIKNTFVPKKLRKRQYFLQKGEVCKYAGFIVKGAMRQYSVDDKGVEHIVRLSIENWWVVDRESYVNLTPSVYNIDAWEDTELLVITKADFFQKLNQIPAIVEMSRKLDEGYYIATQKRLNASISFSAEKRYADFAGEKYTEPIVAEGPFVMNSRGEIAQAYKDFHAGKYGEVNSSRNN